MTPTQEEEVLVKSIELIKGLTGAAPKGYVAPWWEMSASTADLLLKARVSLTITAKATAIFRYIMPAPVMNGR